MADPAERMPLSALLSQALVAFTIEFDNEFEHRTPHRTTEHGSTADARGAPWLVSMAMWIRYLRFVPDDGITVRELGREAALSNQEMKIWLTRLSKWWGYLVIDAEGKVKPTPGGRKALQVWRPLSAIIEERWRQRFGGDSIDRLCQALNALVSQFDPELADSLPILGYDLLSVNPGPPQRRVARRDVSPAGPYTLPILLSKSLLAFASRYERESGLSLAISANLLRVGGQNAILVRDLPRLSGVSKEAIAMAVKRLEEGGLATVQPESTGSRFRAFRLTALGQRARDDYHRLARDVENHWTTTFGQAVSELRSSLEHLADDLLKGLEPYPDGWRAAVARPDVLPHFPSILHRGGFPDGS
jgi:DNA-binding MarR family transcriptional regulator